MDFIYVEQDKEPTLQKMEMNIKEPISAICWSSYGDNENSE